MLLREIEVFRAVMAAGSTSKAATLLGISQPGVSQIIRKLEDAAEFSLFDRVRGRLVPTTEAVALLQEVDRCFVGLDMIEHRMRSLRSGSIDRLRIAAYPAYGMGFMPRAIARLPIDPRRMNVSLQVMSSRDVYQSILAGQFDFGLMADETSTAGLEHSTFARTQGVVVMSRQHRLASKALIEPQDLDNESFIALNPEDASRRRLESLLALAGHTLAPVVQTPYASTVCEFALVGVGIGLANPMVAIDYVERGLVVRPFALDVAFTCVLAFRPGTSMVKNARMLECMRLQLADDLERLQPMLAQPRQPGRGALRVAAG